MLMKSGVSAINAIGSFLPLGRGPAAELSLGLSPVTLESGGEG
ncbi:MAG: hypothetical protein ABTQ25_00220 [Nitrosomonas ureae]